MSSHKDNHSWLLLGLGIVLPIAAAKLSRSLIGTGYQTIARREPPRNPASPEVEWKDAIVWSVLTGAAAGVTRLATRRALAPSVIPSEGYDMDEAEADVVE